MLPCFYKHCVQSFMNISSFAFQLQRCPPQVPERVRYYNLQDVRKDTSSLPFPWFVIPTTEDRLEFGVLDDFVLVHKVVIDSTLKGTVFTHGKERLVTNMEKNTITSFLQSLLQSSVCPGITEEHLQDQVPSKSVKFLQLIIPKKKGVQSCIRASSCQGIINTTTSDLGLCEPCNQSKKELERLHLKSMDKASLKSSTPLVHASHKKLVWAVKNLRRKKRRLAHEVQDLKAKMGQNSVNINQSMHTELKDRWSKD